MMGQKVKIRVRGEQRCAGEAPGMTVQELDGWLEKDGEDWLLSYDEPEQGGLQGTRTAFRFGAERVTLTRSGQVRTEMVFEPGQRHTTFYELALGVLTMDVLTQLLDVQLDGEGGAMDLRYTLAAGEKIFSENRVLLEVAPCVDQSAP